MFEHIGVIKPDAVVSVLVITNPVLWTIPQCRRITQSMIQSILVVCEGNICRSPMAAALLKERLPATTIVSAGLGALLGQPADASVATLLAARGLDVSTHRAQQLSERLCNQANLILVMERHQKDQLERRYPLVRGKVFCLGAYGGYDVFDPYLRSRECFEACYQLIRAGVERWADDVTHLTS